MIFLVIVPAATTTARFALIRCLGTPRSLQHCWRLSALYATTGGFNTTVGNFALRNNSNGFGNTGIGYSVLYYNGSGSQNTAIGDIAGAYITGNVCIGVNIFAVAGQNYTTRIRNAWTQAIACMRSL